MTQAGGTGLDVAALLARLAAYPRRITADSRAVEAGVAFAAYPGSARDGRAFIDDAVARGAAAVLWEPREFEWNAQWHLPNAGVPQLKHALGSIADFLYGSPSQELWMVGVTGTNGKTSCAHWIAQALDAYGRRAAILGTLGNGLVGALAPAPNTTPDVCVLHELLTQLKQAGATAVAMEVSSHGLDQGRVNAVKFDVALFTNLSRDHLDYHGTMAAYGAAKARLFAWPGLRTAVLNADDDFGRSLIDDARRRGQRHVTYGLADADIAATSLAMGRSGLVLSVATPWGRGEVDTQVVGAFNASNLLGVLGVLLASDVPFDAALSTLRHLTPPAGRMQRLGGDGAPLVVVDYAHTPDALEKALGALRPAVRAGRELRAVFGCGGDRDKGKRPQMGRIAASLADRVYVTNDNPRSEDPQAIAQAIVHGIRETANRRFRVELDRAAAIRLALEDAQPGDVVLIAGKGHEAYQETAGVRRPFSDLAAARDALHAVGVA
ncbi:MAG TPA: UDP-N-acetylmuramoyl-L-alanyl-D-glutamate--2,6-diaminopimelate ligase [Casimicrobiaceae bacterium]|nr:UDP-N-acetylmuramoyl-L-alanyl-D-glutamate--2,6-diaminopimelate ligase [Casimicrobiaceae bacterium]